MYTKRLVSICAFALLLFITLPGFGENQLSKHSRNASRPQQLKQLQQAQASRLDQSRVRRAMHTQSAFGTLGRSLAQLQAMTALPATNRIGFLSALQIPAGGDPSGAAVTGDFNGDGKLDVATTVYNPSTEKVSVSVALGNGDGTFQTSKLTASLANDPYQTVLLVADVNGDHKDDLLLFCEYATDPTTWTFEGKVEVFISNGTGTFAAPVAYTTGAAYVAAATALDTNGDHVPDLTAVSPDGQVITMLNNGNGTFQTPLSVPYSGNLSNAVIADLNGDGKLDFAGFDNTAYRYQVYLAASDGGFQAPAQLAAGDINYACSIVAGDLSGDGKPELVTSSCDYISPNLTIYKNNGNGTFDGGTSLWAGFYTQGLSIADVNGDGKNDVVALNGSSGDITVLLGNGDGTVQGPTLCGDTSCSQGGYAVGGTPWTTPAIADFNSDGKPDAIVTDDQFSFVYLQGYGDGTFRAGMNYYGPRPADDSWPKSNSLAEKDLNNDNYPDVVVAGSGTANAGLTVLLNDKKGGLKPGVTIATGEFQYVAIGSFHGYFNADIAATSTPADAPHSVQIFLNNGDGTFQVPKSYPVSLDSTQSIPQGVVAADFNGDSKDDLAVIDLNGGVSVLLNDGLGGFGPPLKYAVPGGGYQLAVEDLDKDGKLDIVAADFYNDSVEFLRGHGDGTFDAAQSLAVGTSPDGIAVADLNGDHNPDIAVAHWDDNTIAVLTGNGNGTFNTPLYYPASLQSTSNGVPNAAELRIADIDGDGFPDLVWENDAYGTVGVLYGDGQGNFAGPVEFPIGSDPWGLVIADMNLDGAPDVVTSNNNMLGATVLLNAGGDNMQGAATPNPAQLGQPIVLTATVAGTVKGVSATPTGTVEFDLGSNILGTASLINGSASLDAPSIAAGDYKVLARYSGDKLFRPKSISITFSVNKLATTTTVTSSANPSMENDPVTFTATVTTGASAATGTVTFKDGTTTLGTGSLDANGKATFTTSTLPTGTRSIMAVYGGNATYAGSTSPTLGQVVKGLPGTTTTSLTSSANPSVTGHSVTFTATVTSTTPGTISGTVAFKDGATSLGTGSLDASGHATYSTSALTIGPHNITATYGGDDNYTVSTSPALSQVVNDLAATTVSVTSSANPAVTGHSVNLTASVTSTVQGTITGTVTFKDGTTSLGTGTVDASGKATLSTTSLAAGTHSITAVYGGNSNYASSTSAALAQIVLASAPDYTLTANPTNMNIIAGQTGTSTITATADEYFNGLVSFSCGTVPTGVTCNFNPSSVNPTYGHPAQSTLTVTTTAQTAALTAPVFPARRNGVVPLLASLAGVGLFGTLILGDFSSRKRRFILVLVGVLAFLLVLGLTGCGGGSKTNPSNPTNPNRTPLGQSTVQVSTTATAGTTEGNTAAHSLTLTITVSQ